MDTSSHTRGWIFCTIEGLGTNPKGKDNMKRNDDGLAVLNEKEQAAYTHREYLTGTHHLSQTDAAEQALGVYDGKPSKEFADYLSGGTLTIVKGKVERVEPAPATA